jgi:hypothetical protein
MPFGLCNAPAVSQSLMHGKAFNKYVCVFLDDVLVFFKTKAEHLRHLRFVFETLRTNGLRARREKCEFFKPELKFLGNIVSAQGMRPDQSSSPRRESRDFGLISGKSRCLAQKCLGLPDL